MAVEAIKVAFSGTHSTGKTTACDALAARLEAAGVKTMRLPEVARACPWPVNRDASPAAQRWIFHRQCLEELDAMREAGLRGIDVVICDRAILDNILYSKWHFDKAVSDCCMDRDGFLPEPGGDVYAWGFWRDAWSLFNRPGAGLDGYDLVFLTAPDGGASDDGFRDTDEAWRLKIAGDFRTFWKFARDEVKINKMDRPLIMEYDADDRGASAFGAVMMELAWRRTL
jgi:nicotinamide riboside kinase